MENGDRDGDDQSQKEDSRTDGSSNSNNTGLNNEIRGLAQTITGRLDQLQTGQDRLDQRIDEISQQIALQPQLGAIVNAAVGRAHDPGSQHRARNRASVVAQIQAIIQLDPSGWIWPFAHLYWPVETPEQTPGAPQARETLWRFDGEHVVGLQGPAPGWRGHWQYRTRGEGSDEAQAWLNAGTQENPYPTAAQVLQLRNTPRGPGEVDRTEGIHFVWVPTARVAGAGGGNGPGQTGAGNDQPRFLPTDAFIDSILDRRENACPNPIRPLTNREVIGTSADRRANDLAVEHDSASHFDLEENVDTEEEQGEKDDGDRDDAAEDKDKDQGEEEHQHAKDEQEHQYVDGEKHYYVIPTEQNSKSIGVELRPLKDIIPTSDGLERLTRRNSTRRGQQNDRSSVPPPPPPPKAPVHPSSKPVQGLKRVPRKKPVEGPGKNRPMLPEIILGEIKRAQSGTRNARGASAPPALVEPPVKRKASSLDLEVGDSSSKTRASKRFRKGRSLEDIEEVNEEQDTANTAAEDSSPSRHYTEHQREGIRQSREAFAMLIEDEDPRLRRTAGREEDEEEGEEEAEDGRSTAKKKGKGRPKKQGTRGNQKKR